MHTLTKASPLFAIQNFFWIAMDWLYPPSCAACGKKGERLCTSCQQQIIPIDHQQACPLCDLPAVGHLCPDCQSQKPSFDLLRSYGVYEGALRQSIHELKYENDLALADTLCHLLISLYKQQNWTIDLICPVPLSPQRLRERGYNQSALLAQLLAWAVSTPFNNKALIRIRETRSQVGLNAEQRRINVKNAFAARSKIVQHKAILLVDDIATTSATLSACAEALKAAGAEKVYALTLARTVHLDSS
ncbi:predicted amidophosphoribosyltransferases [Bellilinea caldifistulae]|nr:ComF family protein [Bellilinea caldifistulae]GAP11205.1 predicted amidophosphoribosyltransferases [Bellilinea caldifistulae]